MSLKPWDVLVVALVALLPLGVLFLRSYFQEKGKNLATRQDIEEITEKIEGVRKQYTSEIEVLRSNLSRQSHIHNIAFEKEFEILSEVWASLVELQAAAMGLRPVLDSVDPKESEDERKQKRLKQFGEAFGAFTRVVIKNRPFYPTEIYSQLLSLRGLAIEEAVEYQWRNPTDKGSGRDPEYWKKAHQNAEKIIQKVDEICELIRKRIEA
jgi:hypothetical protein